MKSLFILIYLMSFSAFSQEQDPLNIRLGEKLFMDGRFSQGYFDKAKTVNEQIAGAAVLEQMYVLEDLVEHPQKGQQVSCSSCHMVDQNTSLVAGSVLTYNDFARRSPIPLRSDKMERTVRNSMNMVLSAIGGNKPLHWDGEFYSAQGLAKAAMVGRNMGWLVTEAKTAKAHIVKVLRGDDGSYPTDADVDQSYTEAFSELGIDIAQLSDSELYDQAAQTMGEYMESLDFSRDQQGAFNGSAYDQFLILNGIRTSPKLNETSQEYLTYLRDHINWKTDWKWLGGSDLKYHQHQAQFGKTEFQGMQLFFGKAQCVTCHTPPEFTDFLFHNTGISQFEYESVHGRDSFKSIEVPTWTERRKNPEKYFVATGDHPNWQGAFRSEANKQNNLATDFGVWNIFGHPDMAGVQEFLRRDLCRSLMMPGDCKFTNDMLLNKSLAMFKTPTLRSLGQSGPYLHNGAAQHLTQVIHLYMHANHMERRGLLVNADPFIRAINITHQDFAPIRAFLDALDEDYD